MKNIFKLNLICAGGKIFLCGLTFEIKLRPMNNINSEKLYFGVFSVCVRVRVQGNYFFKEPQECSSMNLKYRISIFNLLNFFNLLGTKFFNHKPKNPF